MKTLATPPLILIRIATGPPTWSYVIAGDDERMCCVQAEAIIRDWFLIDVVSWEIQRSEDQLQADRISTYLADVAREAAMAL